MGVLATSPLVIRHILRSSPSPFLKPLSSSSSFCLLKQPALSISFQTSSICSFVPSFFSPICSLSSASLPPQSLSYINVDAPIVKDESESDVESETDDTQNFELEKESVSEFSEDVSGYSSKKYDELVSKLPSLTIKEKKELASYAHSLGKKLKSQQVGKSGVTDSVATALVETLEANELLKLKIHSNCPGELDDVVKQLEASTGSVVVGRIGRTVILYRPSLTKLKAEEKKLQARRVFVRRQQAFKASLQNRRQASEQSGGRRGRSRF